jgi:hypothetical protein
MTGSPAAAYSQVLDARGRDVRGRRADRHEGLHVADGQGPSLLAIPPPPPERVVGGQEIVTVVNAYGEYLLGPDNISWVSNRARRSRRRST